MYNRNDSKKKIAKKNARFKNYVRAINVRRKKKK